MKFKIQLHYTLADICHLVKEDARAKFHDEIAQHADHDVQIEVKPASDVLTKYPLIVDIESSDFSLD